MHEHLKKLAGHHRELARHEKAKGELHEQFAEGHAKANHKELAALHKSMAKVHANAAAEHEATADSFEDCAKAAMEQESATEKIAKAALVPDRVSAILPTSPIRPVFRAGQRQFAAEKAQVSAEFESLFSLEEGL
jgi:hypothetical protein